MPSKQAHAQDSDTHLEVLHQKALVSDDKSLGRKASAGST